MKPEEIQAIRKDWKIDNPDLAVNEQQTINRLLDEIERLRGALERIERRAEQAERQFENRVDNPWRWDLSWWRGHSDGLYKSAEIARQALEG